MTELACTPGQTVGPFFGLALPYPGGSVLVGDAHPEAVRLHGTVYDGAGDGVPDALVELWQPDGAGRIPRVAGSLRRDGAMFSGFTGFGRAATDADGHYGFTTVTPGSVAGRPPFFAITVFARGLLNRLFTRAYLPDGDLDADPLLATVEAGRRAALVCVAESASGRPGYRFDIHLQGPNQTVFLTYRDDGR
jgi:protocatechuate 3,4-dioxygenase, alpha subunit